MKPIPETIRIGAYTVTVRHVDNLLRDQGCCGRFLPCQKRIEIEPSMNNQMQWGTICHEMIEAMTEIYTIQPLAENYSAIDVLGEVLHQVLRDNGEEILPA